MTRVPPGAAREIERSRAAARSRWKRRRPAASAGGRGRSPSGRSFRRGPGGRRLLRAPAPAARAHRAHRGMVANRIPKGQRGPVAASVRLTARPRQLGDGGDEGARDPAAWPGIAESRTSRARRASSGDAYAVSAIGGRLAPALRRQRANLAHERMSVRLGHADVAHDDVRLKRGDLRRGRSARSPRSPRRRRRLPAVAARPRARRARRRRPGRARSPATRPARQTEGRSFPDARSTRRELAPTE